MIDEQRFRARAARWPVGVRVQAVPDGDQGTLVRLVQGPTPGSTYAVVAWDGGWTGRISLTQLDQLNSPSEDEVQS